jgi:hypothetical protein
MKSALLMLVLLVGSNHQIGTLTAAQCLGADDSGAKDMIHALLPQFEPTRHNPEDVEPAEYRRMNPSEKLKFVAMKVAEGYWGGDESWRMGSLVQNDRSWLFPKLAQADPKAFGDLCKYDDAPVQDVLGNIGGFSLTLPQIDPAGRGTKVSFENTFIRPDSLLPSTDVYGIWTKATTAGQGYWVDRMFAKAGDKSPTGISLEEYYDQQLARLSKRDRLILTLLLLTEPACDLNSDSPLRRRMKSEVRDIESLPTRKAVDAEWNPHDSINWIVREHDRFIKNAEDLLGHPLL